MASGKPKSDPAPAPAQTVVPTATPADPTKPAERNTANRSAAAQANETPQLITGTTDDEEQKRKGLLTGQAESVLPPVQREAFNTY